jgi:hypothetical protein
MSGRNVPAGWATFCALRKTPTRHPQIRHGNWKHGNRSRSGIQQWRELRFAIRALAALDKGHDMAMSTFMAWLFPLRPIGWCGFLVKRTLGADGAAAPEARGSPP